jgi:tetratricopeptide (TPR) repeat protein
MNETPKSKRGWRILRRILIGLAMLATLIAVLYAEEDWRGKHAWENYKREWEAKGEKFDWQAFVPPSVPNDQNFFTAPIFTNILNSKIAMTPYGKDGGPDMRPDASKTGYAINRMWMTDLQAWQNYYRNPTNFHAVNELVMTNGDFLAQTNYLNHATDKFPIAPEPQTPAKDVLLALSKFDSAVEELRQASQRPYARIPLNYQDGVERAKELLPVLAELKRCSQLLQLRASAELADGQNEKALGDVKLLLYLNNSLRSSPFLISHLVRIAIVAINVQPIWEGMAEHKWSDEQLIALDAELAKLDFLADYEFTMRGERAFEIASFENQRRTREAISSKPEGFGLITNKLTLMPSAYFYQNEMAYARVSQQWILPLVNMETRVVSPDGQRRADQAIRAEMKPYSPYKAQALMTSPVIASAVKLFTIDQASVDLARVACALERYRLAHGGYPETLDTLAPQFIAKLPHDIINGQPLHYRRTKDGNFVLYSVGLNEKDDGGEVVIRKGGSAVDQEQGDWVWQYPPK